MTEALIMGVLNVTPDSFSDGGSYVDLETAVARAELLVAQGADIIDVGGESTRPGSTRVTPADELARVMPVIQALTARGFSVSIDTLNASTAAAAVSVGVDYINDVSGGLYDPEMLTVAANASAKLDVTFIAGHWRGIPDPNHSRSDYDDVVAEVREALGRCAHNAINAGVDPENIVLDPGFGFDKTGAQAWELLANLSQLTDLGFPVLIGTSRKRMLGEVLAEVPEAARDLGLAHDRDLTTAVSSVFAAQAGAWGVRVHDAASSAQAFAVLRAFEAAPIRATEPALTVAEAQQTKTASKPLDRVTLTGLEVFAHHGVFDFEREQGQRFLIDADVAVDLRAAASGDDLAATVHYGELAEAIVAAVENDPVDLIETVAERVADVTLGFSGVHSARITVHKPQAPIDAVFADVSVSVERFAKGVAR
ncbi:MULTISPECIES: dihydropteroate synthase [unclassified Leucobacter]|uniref:dihydropteroate synthase n=1 Tax=unclassified Leucobacter TaxID=2621730 RepID=UPI00203ED30C|nr:MULTISPECIES: dihydropteroate synthase [unclassified Leucobacter]